MKSILSILILISLINYIKNIKFVNNNKNNYLNNYGVYRILSLSNNNYFKYNNKEIILSLSQQQFLIIRNKFNTYYIISRRDKKLLGINDKNKMIFYDNHLGINYLKISWKIIKIYENEFIIQNIYNKKYIEENLNFLQCINIPIFFLHDNLYNIFFFNVI